MPYLLYFSQATRLVVSSSYVLPPLLLALLLLALLLLALLLLQVPDTGLQGAQRGHPQGLPATSIPSCAH
jgi:hypothetical protein